MTDCTGISEDTLSVCLGISQDDFSTWTSQYKSYNCTEIFNRYLFDDGSGINQYNPNNLTCISNFFNTIFNNYTNKYGKVIGNTGDYGYDPFQDVIKTSCYNPQNINALPGACDNWLINNLCVNKTRQQISDSVYLIDYCGCFAPGDASFPMISPQCDPLCQRVNTIQLPNFTPSNPSGDGTYKICDETVCVIDNISINATNTLIGGNISIQQVCGTTPDSGPVKCIVGGVNINDTINSVGPQALSQFAQYCGPNSECLQIVPGQPDLPVSCPVQTNNTPSNNNTTIFIYTGLILIAIVIIAIILYFFIL